MFYFSDFDVLEMRSQILELSILWDLVVKSWEFGDLIVNFTSNEAKHDKNKRVLLRGGKKVIVLS